MTLRDFEMRCDCLCHLGHRPECDPICCYLCACGSRIKYDRVDEHKAECPEKQRQKGMRARRAAKRQAV